MSRNEQDRIYLEQAREVLLLEADCVKRQAELLGEDFVKAIELILQCQGRVIVTGMGKSGLVGRKISATLSSTGTPSFFFTSRRGNTRRSGNGHSFRCCNRDFTKRGSG